MNRVILFFLTSILLGPLKLGAQAFYHELNGGSYTLYEMRVKPHGYVLLISKGNESSVLSVNDQGAVVHRFDSQVDDIWNLSFNENKIVLFIRDKPTNHLDSIRLIELDSSLSVISVKRLVRIGWPRQFFATSNFEEQRQNGGIIYFGGFTDNQFNEPERMYGFVRPSVNFDTLFADPSLFQSSAHGIFKIYPTSAGFVTLSFQENVAQSWSPTIGVSKILHLDSNLQLIRATNCFTPSTIPSHPRILSSTRLRNLIVNEHSIYGLTEFEAAEPFSLSNTTMSFALYRFDTALNIKHVHHQLADPGRWAKTSSFGGRTITFDHSRQYIYAIGNNCEPALSFNNQDRTCATVVMKYDTALNLIWRQDIEIPKTYFHAEIVTATPDGGVLVGGVRIDSTPNPNIRNIFVMKLDSAGNHSVAVREQPARPSHRLYPNPATTRLIVQWDAGQYADLVLHNLQGQQVARIPTVAGSNVLEVNIEALPPGLYLYRLESNTGAASLQGKFLKQ